MDCRETRRVLWPADILRVSDAQVERALEHAEGCDNCRFFLEEDRRMARLIRDHLPRVPAPRELRERLYTALARERAGTPPRRRHSSGLPRAVAIVVLLSAGVAMSAAGHWLAGRGKATTPAAAFAEDYLRRVVEQDALETGDRRKVEEFFARELGLSVSPPEIPGLQVQRATICLMNGHRGAVVEYSGGGRHVSYYVVPLGGEAPGRTGQLDVQGVPGNSVSAASLGKERGLGVATWWDDRGQHALVGNLPAGELGQLAPLFAGPVARL